MWVWLIAILVGCSGSDDDEKDDTEKTPVTVVKVESVENGSVADRIVTTAVVEAEFAAEVAPVSPGVVLSVHADDGDSVRRGQLLAVIDNVSLAAGAERSRAEVDRLRRQVAELESLQARGAVSKRELDDLRYQLESAERSRREASRSYGQTRVTAPFDGVVARRHVKIGEIANGPAFSIVNLDSLKVMVDLPERDVGRVAVGQPVQLVSAYDEEIEGKGQVERVSPVIDAKTGTFRATISVAPGQPLRPGQFVNVHLEVARHSDVLVVPRKALLWEDGKPLLYTMVKAPPREADDTDTEPAYDGMIAARTRIEVGLMDDVGVEVLGGVEQGVEVIVVGQSNLKDGAKVRATTDNARVVPQPDAG